MIAKLLLAATALAAVATPSLAQDRWDYAGGRPGDARAYRLTGEGVRFLYPELRGTNRGRAFVLRNFDYNRNGRISAREAQAANRAFASFAGPRRDRFDWTTRDRIVARPVMDGRYDRGAMRDYGFRQTARGATMTMEEQVLFATDSAVLRPGAMARLEPLADYLRENRGVRVAIDGHTDARGTDAHNLDLSRRRADAVRAAFDEMEVTRARFTVEGHGESQPVASNDTAAGMQRNRRVEVTLLGQRADSFRGE